MAGVTNHGGVMQLAQGAPSFERAARRYRLGTNSRNAASHSRWPSVSGSATPRAWPIKSKARVGSEPRQTRADAATNEDRPIPDRQWITTDRPSSRQAWHTN